MTNNNFQENLERLEEIVRMLDNETTPLEQSLELFEEGLQLVKACNLKLTQFDQKINEMLVSHKEAVNE